MADYKPIRIGVDKSMMRNGSWAFDNYKPAPIVSVTAPVSKPYSPNYNFAINKGINNGYKNIPIGTNLMKNNSINIDYGIPTKQHTIAPVTGYESGWDSSNDAEFAYQDNLDSMNDQIYDLNKRLKKSDISWKDIGEFGTGALNLGTSAYGLYLASDANDRANEQWKQTKLDVQEARDRRAHNRDFRF